MSFDPGKAAWIVDPHRGAGFIIEGGQHGRVNLKLTTDAVYNGGEYPAGSVIAILREDLTLDDPTAYPDLSTRLAEQLLWKLEHPMQHNSLADSALADFVRLSDGGFLIQPAPAELVDRIRDRLA